MGAIEHIAVAVALLGPVVSLMGPKVAVKGSMEAHTWALSLSLQGFLESDDADYLEPFRLTSGLDSGWKLWFFAFVDNLRSDLNKGSVSLLILLDLLPAFNTINHSFLLECLSSLRVGGLILHWFWYYFSDRITKGVLGDYYSSSWPLAYGELQGMILTVPHVV